MQKRLSAQGTDSVNIVVLYRKAGIWDLQKPSYEPSLFS